MLHLEHEPDVAGQNSLKFLASLVQFFFGATQEQSRRCVYANLGMKLPKTFSYMSDLFPQRFSLELASKLHTFPLQTQSCKSW